MTLIGSRCLPWLCSVVRPISGHLGISRLWLDRRQPSAPLRRHARRLGTRVRGLDGRRRWSHRQARLFDHCSGSPIRLN